VNEAFEMTAKQSLALRIGLDCALIAICATLFSKNHLVDGFLCPLDPMVTLPSHSFLTLPVQPYSSAAWRAR
jgi:hypothetical protein